MPKKLMPAAMKRLYQNMYICMNCNARNRATVEKVKQGKVKCRKCGSYELRPKAKERRGATV